MKKITNWSDSVKVGIWDNCNWSCTLYPDRIVLREPEVKWTNNSGSLHTVCYHIPGNSQAYRDIATIHEHEISDIADYTERVRAEIEQYLGAL